MRTVMEALLEGRPANIACSACVPVSPSLGMVDMTISMSSRASRILGLEGLLADGLGRAAGGGATVMETRFSPPMSMKAVGRLPAMIMAPSESANAMPSVLHLVTRLRSANSQQRRVETLPDGLGRLALVVDLDVDLVDEEVGQARARP